jgi:ATP/ADP translocase
MIARVSRILLIKPAERGLVGYFLVLFFLLGAGMALGRGSTDALFLKRYGIEYLPVMYIILSVMLMTVSIVYAAFSDLLPAERFFKILYSILIVVLVCNWVLMSFSGADIAYPIYFLVYEIASEILLVHATLYMGQNFETLQSKRLFPLIFAGMQIGTIAGGIFLASTVAFFGVQNMLLAWGGILALSITLIAMHHKRHGLSPYYRSSSKHKARIKQASDQMLQGVKFVKQSDLLRSLSIALFFMVITFYVLCYSVNRVYTNVFQTEESLTSFYGVLTAFNSTLALAMQIFLTNRVLRRFGVKRTNMFFPLCTAFSYVGLMFSFTLPFALIGSFNKDAIMPAFRNPVRNLFFNALPNYMQGRARAMSIALVLPLALAVTGGLLLLAQLVEDPKVILAVGATSTLAYLF